MLLRPATIADAEVLKHWDEQPHVIESDPNDDWHWDDELPRTPWWREFLIAEHEGQPIGFVQIINAAAEESHYWGEIADDVMAIDIWIGEADQLGQGHGSEMMRLAIERCFANPHTASVIIDPLASNTRAIRFYERFGFRFVERRRFGADDCHVMQLSRSAYQAGR